MRGSAWRAAVGAVLLGWAGAAAACPICVVGAGPTHAQRLVDADTVLLVAPEAGGWRTVEVVKGTAAALPRGVPAAAEAAAAAPGHALVVLREPGTRWATLGALPPQEAAWLRRVASGRTDEDLSEADWRARVLEHVSALEHPVPLVAETAYQEVARAPYAAMRGAHPLLDASRLQRWLDDPALAARRPLYTLLLGVAGGTEAARRVDRRLDTLARERDVTDLSALLVASLEIHGPSRVAWIEGTYLLDRGRAPAETAAALLALSEQGHADARVPRARVVAAYRAYVRSGAAQAGYVAPDLGRWRDWSAVPDFAALIRSGARQHPASVYATLAYLDAAPSPEARSAAAALRARLGAR